MTPRTGGPVANAAHAPALDTNPKDAVGRTKPGLTQVPPSAMVELGRALADGERKYGLMNWRRSQVSARVYLDAAYRHLMAYVDGEDVASDSGVPHLAHVMACCAILLDAQRSGTLIDDRGEPGDVTALIAALADEPQEGRSDA